VGEKEKGGGREKKKERKKIELLNQLKTKL